MNEEEFSAFIDKVDAIVKEPIHGEFEYQNKLAVASNWDHKNVPAVAEEILVAGEYVGKARTAWVHNQGDQ